MVRSTRYVLMNLTRVLEPHVPGLLRDLLVEALAELVLVGGLRQAGEFLAELAAFHEAGFGHGIRAFTAVRPTPPAREWASAQENGSGSWNALERRTSSAQTEPCGRTPTSIPRAACPTVSSARSGVLFDRERCPR